MEPESADKVLAAAVLPQALARTVVTDIVLVALTRKILDTPMPLPIGLDRRPTMCRPTCIAPLCWHFEGGKAGQLEEAAIVFSFRASNAPVHRTQAFFCEGLRAKEHLGTLAHLERLGPVKRAVRSRCHSRLPWTA